MISVILLNNRGEIVAERGGDLPNGAPMKIPDSLQSHLVPGDVLLQHPNTKQGVSGIVMLPEGPLLVTSRPIVKTNGNVPPEAL
jgi:sensor domain CHASE-containing protein